MKKLISLAALAAMLVPAMPAGAAVTQTGTVTVKWNTTVVATLALTSNYVASGATAAGAPTVLSNTNGGAGNSCSATGSGAAEPQAPNPTVNFGNITPDANGVDYTDCLYTSAVNAQVKTNSTNWTLGENVDAAKAATTLCAFGNNFALTTIPATVSGAAAVTVSARSGAAPTAGATSGACGAGGQSIPAAAPTTFYSSSTAYPAGANVGQDLELLIGPTSPSGAQQFTLTYTLVAN